MSEEDPARQDADVEEPTPAQRRARRRRGSEANGGGAKIAKSLTSCWTSQNSRSTGLAWRSRTLGPTCRSWLS
jgi:hypothetical protein